MIQLTRLYMDFQMACGNALKHLKNAQKLLKELSCHGIRGRDLLGLVTGERSEVKSRTSSGEGTGGVPKHLTHPAPP